jgi:hypothetical protein
MGFAVVMIVISFFVGLICLLLSLGLDRTILRWTDVAGLRVSTNLVMSELSFLMIGTSLLVWTLSSAAAVTFALRKSIKAGLVYGLSLGVILGACIVALGVAWSGPQSSKLSGVTALIAIAVAGAGVVVRALLRFAVRWQLLAVASAIAVLTVPWWVTVASTPLLPPGAAKEWSIELDRNPWQSMNTGSSFESRRHMVFAGNKLLASYYVSMAASDGHQPMSNYRLVSIDLGTGAIVSSRDLQGKWAAMPILYVTKGGQAVLSHGDLKLLKPDLSEAGPAFVPGRGRVSHISPDGSTMAWETTPGSTLIDAETLTALPQHLSESTPTSVSKQAVLTDNIYWIKDYPNDHAFVTLTDEKGQHLLFHGACGGGPEFLSDDKVILAGCGKIRIIDTSGRILRETESGDGSATFAGVSQNGQRFAVEFSEVRGDPPAPLYDHFIIYDAETARAVAMVRVGELPEYNAWAAFSADGKYFAAGTPNELTLYRIP